MDALSKVLGAPEAAVVPVRNAAGQPISGPCTDQMPTAAAVSAANAPAAPAAPLPEPRISAASAASATAPSSSGSAPCQWRSPQRLAWRAFTCHQKPFAERTQKHEVMRGARGGVRCGHARRAPRP